jgi:SAM-dependent methyltransferase
VSAEREKLLEHRRLWQAKPALRQVYAVWFDALLAELPDTGRVLEVGAGPGFLAERARHARPDLRWWAADLLEAPWNDLVANAHRLPFADAACDGLAALDVLHHLAEPEHFFREAGRVLKPRGRLVTIEPWLSPFSYPIYRFLHQEGHRPGLDPWRPFEHLASKQAFDGDSGVVTLMVRSTPAARWVELGFGAPRVRLLNGFAYLPTLGFRPRSLLPGWLCPLARALDRRSAPLARWLAMRAILVWERAAEPSGRLQGTSSQGFTGPAPRDNLGG